MVRMLEYALKSMTRNPGGRLDRCVRWDRWEGGGAGAGATGAPEAECKGRPLRNQRMLSGGSPSSMTHEIYTRALIITWGMWNGLIRGAAGFRPENSGIFFFNRSGNWGGRKTRGETREKHANEEEEENR